MKNIYKSMYMKMSMTLMIVILAFSSCEIDTIVDPNGPSLEGIETNATIGELRTVVAGVESLMRQEIAFYYDVLGIVGREWYFFTNSDPRYTGELLGKAQSTLDNAGFYGTRPYAGRYRVILNTNILIRAVNNSSADLTAQEKNGFIGFARTMEAYSLLLALNMQYTNGIRTDVSDPDNLGGFKDFPTALGNISTILDDADGLLNNAGSEFAFPLSSGFAGFDTPASLSQFNRGIKARVEMYRGNKAAVLTALSSSFMDMAGNLDTGPSHFYSEAGSDEPNQMFRTPDQSEALIAHPSHITDIQPGDDRINKVTLRPSGSRTLDGLSGDYDVTIWSSFASPLVIMRNEELILLQAEGNIGSNNPAAVTALNVIRNAHGLANYSGATTDAALEDELLYNRRYSLFGEAHRWIDMRRYNRLNSLPLDRVDDDVWEKFPRPVSEVGVQGG